MLTISPEAVAPPTTTLMDSIFRGLLDESMLGPLSSARLVLQRLLCVRIGISRGFECCSCVSQSNVMSSFTTTLTTREINPIHKLLNRK